MLQLRIVQANYGDSFILEYGSQEAPRYALIDGGPGGVYRRHLRNELGKIDSSGGRLDFLSVSHVDADHIVGLLDLLAELRHQRTNEGPETIAIDNIWHNSFERSIDVGSAIESRFASAVAASGTNMSQSANDFQGIGQGRRLRILASQLRIEVNQGFPNDLIAVDDAPGPIAFDNLKLRIVGPTRANLEALREEWLKWLDDHEPNIASGDPQLMANADESIPNLSSIMFLAEADGKTVLFTGDGRSDHLLDGLRDAELLDAPGRLHVDVFKVAHHGSDRNATRGFFRKVTADTYVISANGHPDNPDLSTLIWIVEAARRQNRRIKIIATNETRSTRKLRREYDEAEYGYELEVMPSNWHYNLVELSS